MADPGLFDLNPAWRTTPAEQTPRTQEEMISAARRRTKRIRRDLAAGRHPLAGTPLHPEAAPADDRAAPGRRCGNCRFRDNGANGRSYPKCWFGWDGVPGHAPPRASNGPATDVRAWWSACRDHQPEDTRPETRV